MDAVITSLMRGGEFELRWWDLRVALTDAAAEERSLKEVSSVVIWRTCAHSVSSGRRDICVVHVLLSETKNKI